ncbi:Fic family protein [uncultured Hymenobacter sp.]|uniref:Fic family protein n=1 Tax=uncultured Hymenobacter sp. TaxID=170016 RepID=UPI0035CC625F
MPLFADLDRLKAELDALRPLKPEQEQRVLQKFRLEWNYNSNAIEGNSLTLGETRSLLLHGLTAQGKPIRDHLDIRGHNEAVLWLEDFVRDQRPLTEQFIRGMHEVLLGEPFHAPAQTADGQPTRKFIQPGQYKQQPNNVLTATGEMLYFASPEETPAKMTDLVDWCRRETEQPTLHPVELAAEFHYRFVRIHPFDDGNGRMSRLLMNLILMRAGYAITVIKADDRNRYLAALSEADAGEPEPFLRFIIENVEASLRLMIRAAMGESVDEPDDLDKKIALLKKQMVSREEFEKTTWNAETQRSFYQNFFKFWVEDAWHTMRKLNDLFFKTEVWLEVRDHNNRIINDAQNVWLDELMHSIEEVVMDDERMIKEISLRFDWQDFRKAGFYHHQGVRFIWRFEKFKCVAVFSLHPGSHHHEQDLQYGQAYDLNRMKEINHQFATASVDFIAAKVAEADTPPQP